MQTKNTPVPIYTIEKYNIISLASIFARPWLSKQANIELWQQRLEEHKTQKRIICLIEENDLPVAYCTLLLLSQYPPFKLANIPEINDLWVMPENRKKGYATQLITHLEKCAQQAGYTTIGIGVGLYKGYGAAQRLYPKLGYIPDGNGITYKFEPVIPGKEYPVDDDLLLWLIKLLY